MRDSRRRATDRQTYAIGAALIAAVGVAAIDLAVPGGNFSSLFLFVPLIASTAMGVRKTAMFGAASLVLGGIFLAIDGATTGEIVVRVLGLLLGSAVAVALSAGRSSRDRRLEDLDNFATIAQELIIRPVPARLAGVRAAGRYLSASTFVAVGGDLYDVALTPGGVRFIVGDACGKGLGGVRLAAEVLSTFREAVFSEPDLVELARQLDEKVVLVCRRERRELDFVTAVIGELRDDGGLGVVSCGHPDGVLVTRSGITSISPPSRAYPLGLGSNPEIAEYQLEIGDRALWWTDGAAEARDSTGTFIDLEGTIAAEMKGQALPDALDAIVAAVQTHVSGDIHDDLALLAFERMIPAPAGSWPGAARALP